MQDTGDTTPRTPARPTPREPALSLRGVGKRFGAVHALTDVDLDVHRHEVVALVGDNGAGKSTLAKIIAGVHRPDSGTILSEGTPVSIPSPAAARALGIATVFQNYPLCENLDIVANLFLGQEVCANTALDEYAMEKATRRVLTRLTTRKLAVRQPVSVLSNGQKQSVAIARSLLGSPRIVILDEPTAALSIAQSAEVLLMIERLRDLDHGILLISHNIAEVQAVADRVVVLRRGRNNGTFDADHASYEDLIAAITGAHVELDPPARQTSPDFTAKNAYPDRRGLRRSLRGLFSGG